RRRLALESELFGNNTVNDRGKQMRGAGLIQHDGGILAGSRQAYLDSLAEHFPNQNDGGIVESHSLILDDSIEDRVLSIAERANAFTPLSVFRRAERQGDPSRLQKGFHAAISGTAIHILEIVVGVGEFLERLAIF